MHTEPKHFARISKITTRQTCVDVANNDNVRITTVVPIFERFIQLGKHVKMAVNISITGAFG